MSYYSQLLPKLPGPFADVEWLTEGFAKWTRRWALKYGEGRPTPGFIPDAFHVDEPDSTLYLLEIVESNDLSEEKLRRINRLAWLLDESDWGLSVLVYYPRQCRAVINDCMILMESKAETLSSFRDAFTVGLREIS